jgi:WD40 repeat protein
MEKEKSSAGTEKLSNLTQPIKVYSNQISSLDFSPNGTVLASGGNDWTVYQNVGGARTNRVWW